MQALILAAGQGSRLRPYTDDRPKALVPLAGYSLLERQLAVFKACGIGDVTVLGGYRAETLSTALGVQVILNPAFETTNMVHSLFCAESLFHTAEDLLISYGDIVYEPRVLEALLACDAPLALTVDTEWRSYWELRQEDPLQDAETLKLDATGRLLELGEKPKGYEDIQAQYMGLIRFRGDQLAPILAFYQAMDRTRTYDGRAFGQMFMTRFLQELIDAGWPIQAVPVAHGWLEVDTVQDLTLYEAMAREGTLSTFCDLSRCGGIRL